MAKAITQRKRWAGGSVRPTVKLTPKAAGAKLAHEWLALARKTGTTDTYSRKHRDPRTTWNVALEMHVISGGGRAQTYDATACDISEGGIGLVCRQPIPPYTRVFICLVGQMEGVAAITLQSAQTLTGYVIGAKFRFEEQTQAAATIVKAG
ncbi:MAG: hypothetical protein ACYS7M_02055 [Planctomycetota bacterium]